MALFADDDEFPLLIDFNDSFGSWSGTLGVRDGVDGCCCCCDWAWLGDVKGASEIAIGWSVPFWNTKHAESGLATGAIVVLC